MLRAAPLKDRTAGIEPAPFVERTHAWPRSPQTDDICGMFGIGTPPLLALLNCASTGSFDVALMLAGGRPFAAASCVWAAGVARKLTKSCAAASTPCVVAYLLTITPCTPRNGTEGFAIGGTWMILNDRPLFLSVSVFQGP